MLKKATIFVILGLAIYFALFSGADLALAKESDVRTDRATDIEYDSATLNGYIDTNDDRDVYVWFEWGERSSSMDFRTPKIFIDRSSGEDFDYAIYNLIPDTTYYFRAVSENDDGDRDYGERKSFNTDDNGRTYYRDYYYDYDNYYYDYNYNDRGPRVVTYPATFTGSNTSVVLNGYVDTFDNATIRWFEWGTSRNYMPNTTSKETHGFDSGNFNATISGLQPNTTYFYRAVAQSIDNPVRGQIFYVTTRSAQTPVYASPSIPNVTPVTVPINTSVTSVPTITIPVKINTITEPATSGPVKETDKEKETNNENADESMLPGLAIFFGSNFFPKTLIGWVLLAILIALLALIAKKVFGTNSPNHTANNHASHGSHDHGAGHEI